MENNTGIILAGAALGNHSLGTVWMNPSMVPELQMLGKSFQVLQSFLECFVTCKISPQSQ